MSNQQLDPALWPEIARRFDAGESYPVLCREYGICNATLYHGINRYEEQEAERVEEAFLSGGRPPTCGFACETALHLCPCFTRFRKGIDPEEDLY